MHAKPALVCRNRHIRPCSHAFPPLHALPDWLDTIKNIGRFGAFRKKRSRCICSIWYQFEECGVCVLLTRQSRKLIKLPLAAEFVSSLNANLTSFASLPLGGAAVESKQIFRCKEKTLKHGALSCLERMHFLLNSASHTRSTSSSSRKGATPCTCDTSD